MKENISSSPKYISSSSWAWSYTTFPSFLCSWVQPCEWQRCHLPSHSLSSPFPPTFSLSQHQGLFKWVSPLHQVAKVLEFQLQHQSFQRTFRTDFEAETPILWPPDAKNWLIWKDPDAGKDWRWEEKGTTEDEMVGWHHWLNGHEFEKTLWDSERQRSLACCSPWGCKELDMTEQLNWTKYITFSISHLWYLKTLFKQQAYIPLSNI